MRGINKKNSFFPVIVIAIITFSLVLYLSVDKQTPYNYLEMNNIDLMTTPSELLFQETLDTGESIVFYINQKGKYNCVIMEDALIGFEIIGYSGSLDLDDTDTYLYGSFVHNQKKIDICWGILVDESISQVFLNNEPCVIVDAECRGIRIFWLLGNWNDVPLLTRQ